MDLESKNRKKIKERAAIIMRAILPLPRCDRGGCKNHTGPCALDVYWEGALQKAEEELTERLTSARELVFA